jgi:hypothetical protein
MAEMPMVNRGLPSWLNSPNAATPVGIGITGKFTGVAGAGCVGCVGAVVCPKALIAHSRSVMVVCFMRVLD